jgi:hypothetical protein
VGVGKWVCDGPEVGPLAWCRRIGHVDCERPDFAFARKVLDCRRVKNGEVEGADRHAEREKTEDHRAREILATGKAALFGMGLTARG